MDNYKQLVRLYLSIPYIYPPIFTCTGTNKLVDMEWNDSKGGLGHSFCEDDIF